MFTEIEENVKGIISDAICRAIKVNSSDFVLLMARGGYHKHLDRPDIDLTPFVLEDREDFLMDQTRRRFFVNYMNEYVNGLKEEKLTHDDEREFELNIQMMIYAHIWESHLFLNQLIRIAAIQQGGDLIMTQDEKWLANWKEIMDFMEVNKRRPSKFIDEERELLIGDD